MVLPRRNLPGAAEDWGRAVEKEIESMIQTLETGSDNLHNQHRSESGKLAVTQNQIEELTLSSSEVIAVPDMSITSSASSEPFPRARETITFPGVRGDRYVFLTFTGYLSLDSSAANRGVVTVFSESVAISRVEDNSLNSSITPNETRSRVPISGYYRWWVEDMQPVQVVLELHQIAFSSATMTFSDIVVTLTRSGAL